MPKQKKGHCAIPMFGLGVGMLRWAAEKDLGFVEVMKLVS